MIIRDWNALAFSERRAVLRRAPATSDQTVRETVRTIIAAVRVDGDAALRELTARYDSCVLEDFRVSESELRSAEGALDPALSAALDEAIGRLQHFHGAATPRAVRVETAPGVLCERILRPIDQVGLYVPAGSAPLLSTVLMLGVPARLAGCPNVVLCTPPGRDGRCDPTVLATARRVGIDRVIKLGGAQAIAALAYGTASVPKCDKIFGPGNAYVTAAKLCVAQDPEGTAIDLPAGPSEVLIVADAAANPEFVAADLLAQAEHGADSQALLLSDSAELLRRVGAEIDLHLQDLPRAAIAAAVLNRCCLIEVASLDQALAISNDYAPEHLILQVSEPRRWLLQVRSAGSVFLGAYAPETLGDYCSGTNHVLPTGGFARAFSGLSVASFLKQITVQEVSSAGLRRIGPCAVAMASAEGLTGHGRAVTLRLASLAEAAA